MSVKEDIGMDMMKCFFSSFLGASSEFMGRATNSMLYRAGEDVGEEFSHLSQDELVAAFHNMGMELDIQQSGIQWEFIVSNSLEEGICGRSYEPCCHMLRGFFSVYVRARVRNPGIRCTETECASSGSDICKFIVSP